MGADGQAGLKSKTAISAHLIAHDEGTVVRVAGEAETIRWMRQIKARRKRDRCAVQLGSYYTVGADLASQF